MSWAGGSRSCYRPWASRAQADPVSPFRLSGQHPRVGGGGSTPPQPEPVSPFRLSGQHPRVGGGDSTPPQPTVSSRGSLALQRNPLSAPSLPPPSPGPSVHPGDTSICCRPTMQPTHDFTIHSCRILTIACEVGLLSLLVSRLGNSSSEKMGHSPVVTAPVSGRARF